MNYKSKNNYLFIFFIICIATLLLLGGCAQSNPTVEVLETPQPTVKSEENPPVEEVNLSETPEISMDFSGIAGGFTLETIPAVEPNSESPYWEIMPEYQVLNLEGYPITNHLFTPKIYLFPVNEMVQFNQGADQIVKDLKNLLESEQIGDSMPFLPLFNAAQVMHTQVEFMDFQNGKGVRFLTQFDQAPLPINNFELLYTFQGLTNDGNYYIAAVLPISHPELPVDDQVDWDQEFNPETFLEDMKQVVEMLGSQSEASFVPDLSTLDTAIQSILVK